jgi:hypothetical protein
VNSRFGSRLMDNVISELAILHLRR